MRYTVCMHLRSLLSLFILSTLMLAAPVYAAAPSAANVCASLKKSAAAAAKAKKPESAKRAKGLQALAASIAQIDAGKMDVNQRSVKTGLTALMVATALKEKETIRWLVAKGAEPAVKDAKGRDSFARAKDEELTALLKEGNIFSWEEALPLLEKYDCSFSRSKEGWAGAAETNQLSYYDLDAVAPDMKLIRFFLRQAKGGVDSINGAHGRRASDLVCDPELTHAQRMYFLNLLLAHGMDFTRIDDGMSAVYHLIDFEGGVDTLPYIKWLVEHGAPVSDFLSRSEEARKEALFQGLESYGSNLIYAVRHGKVDIVRYFLETEKNWWVEELKAGFEQVKNAKPEEKEKQEIKWLLAEALKKAGA